MLKMDDTIPKGGDQETKRKRSDLDEMVLE
jgi:hypothetical protein